MALMPVLEVHRAVVHAVVQTKAVVLGVVAGTITSRPIRGVASLDAVLARAAAHPTWHEVPQRLAASGVARGGLRRSQHQCAVAVQRGTVLLVTPVIESNRGLMEIG